MRRVIAVSAVASVFALAACDAIHSYLQRGVVGAAISCAVGETLINCRCVEGAVVGRATGVLTS